MIVGIMSDSHGDAAATARAVTVLKEHGAEVLFHCGDVCSMSVLDELAGNRAYFVWGNCDTPEPSMRAYVETLGLTWPVWPVRVELDGKRIAVSHGHERGFKDLIRASDVDYVFFGHTHQFEDTKVGTARLINPGALYRAPVKTVATLDLTNNDLTFLTLDGELLQ